MEVIIMARKPKVVKTLAEQIEAKIAEIELTEQRLVNLRAELKELQHYQREEQISTLLQTIETRGLSLEDAIQHFSG